MPEAASLVESGSTTGPAAVAAVRRGAVFLGAFLLFNVQPMIAKAILPWFGGASAVWITCLLFFQGFLLLGYLYAHVLITRVAARWQAGVHGALLALALLFLPLTPVPQGDVASGDPASGILLLLTTCLGLPYLLLAATSPLIQGWHARTEHGAPYRLYALSNLGSLLGLLAYPFLIEPRLGTQAQLQLWSALFAVYAVLAAVLAWDSRQHAVTAEAVREGATARNGETVRDGATARQVSLWLVFSALPTALLLAITGHLTENVTPMPFLWMLPLALYLMTLIVCFDRPRWVPRLPSLWLCGLSLAALSYGLLAFGRGTPLALSVPVLCGSLFFICLFLHGELQRRKPEPQFLTGYYLTMSCGGAIAGLLAALAAPRVLTGPFDLPLVLAVTAVVAHLQIYGRRWWSDIAWTLLLVGVVTVSWGYMHAYSTHVLASGRNFYGSLRVRDDGAGAARVRTEVHGTVSHGIQFLAPERRQWPTTYYGPDSGAARALRSFDGPVRAGLVGLGAGTLSIYERAGDYYRYYELNPMVVDYAQRYFTFLRDGAGRNEVALGDGRLTLQREQPQGYHVLVLDAFSGDAVPAHLLTKEAFALYRRHLRPNGLLTFHISNDYLDLVPVVRAAAATQGWQTALVNAQEDPAKRLSWARWIVVGPAESLRRAVPEQQVVTGEREVLWTDDHSSLFPVLK